MDELRNTVINYFNKLEFNSETHTYRVANKPLKSVSSLIKNYVEPFDTDKIAGFVAIKRSKLEGRYVSKQEILQEWEDKKNAACSKGTEVHMFGENYTPDKIATNQYEASIVNFWDNIPDYIEPFLFELKMFSEAFGLAGTADIILYNTRTGKFIIADYKTNIDLFKNYKGKKMLPPFDFLLDCPYNKYQLQLSLYQILFEQMGFEVEARKIVWLKSDSTYEVFKTQDLTGILLQELTLNKSK